MNGINSISGAALYAFGTAQQVTAHNVANLNTDEFKAYRAEFQENPGGGVTASVAGTGDPVDISREAVNLVSNSSGYKANLKVLKTSDEMSKELLSIKA